MTTRNKLNADALALADTLGKLFDEVARGLRRPEDMPVLPLMTAVSTLRALAQPEETPLAKAVADHADSNQFNAKELELAENLLRVFADRAQVGIAACSAARNGQTYSSHDLGDAAVLLAAVEPLYTSQER